MILFAYHLLNNPFSPLMCVSHLCEVPTYVCEHTLMFHLLNFSCFDSTLHFSEALFYVLISDMISPLSLLLFLKTGLVISKFSFIHILFIVKSEFSKLLKYCNFGWSIIKFINEFKRISIFTVFCHLNQELGIFCVLYLF